MSDSSSTPSAKLLVVGAGSIGERHIRCFLATERAEVALCEVDDRRRSEVGQRYQLSHSFSSLKEALDHAFDAAVIATPADTHLVIAAQLASNGCHLLIEKPLSTSTEHVDRLQQAIAGRALVVAVGYVWRAHPVIADFRAAVASERFGKPLQIVAVAGQHFPTYRPAYREIYYADRRRGGGAIQDALTHLINLGEWLVGPIDSVVADAAHLQLEGVDVEDTVHVIARHGAVMGSYALNQHQAPNEFTITVVCQQGTCRAEPHRNRWRWMVKPDDPWNDVHVDPVDRDELFILQAGAFLDAIAGRRDPLCTLDEAWQTLNAHMTILQSSDDATKFVPVPGRSIR